MASATPSAPASSRANSSATARTTCAQRARAAGAPRRSAAGLWRHPHRRNQGQRLDVGAARGDPARGGHRAPASTRSPTCTPSASACAWMARVIAEAEVCRGSFPQCARRRRRSIPRSARTSPTRSRRRWPSWLPRGGRCATRSSRSGWAAGWTRPTSSSRMATAITSISYDHMAGARQYAGARSRGEKAGIIKPGVPVVCLRPRARGAGGHRARRRGARRAAAPRRAGGRRPTAPTPIRRAAASSERQTFDVRDADTATTPTWS